MNKKGPLVLVEDDKDDQEFMLSALKELQIKNEILLFENGEEAFKHLTKNDIEPFLIISDINMPLMTGTELRDKMQKEAEPKLKAVPFLFFTTGAPRENVIRQYAHSVQGFFQKAYTYEEVKNTCRKIIDYWMECTAPYFTKVD